jgi:MazG family protein
MSDLKARVLDPDKPPFERLVNLFAILRSPEGCSWDRKQTHESLVPYLLEETYEVIEALEAGRLGELAEELGDLLVQVVFHAQLASERGEFTMDDAIEGVISKLVNRHPHVFGDRRELQPQQVRDQWEKIKTDSGEKPSVLNGLPKTMPALTMGFRMGEKAGGVGFDWKSAGDVLEKIHEEVREVEEELHRSPQPDKDKLSEEIGDLLFAVTSLSRKLDIEPEQALRKALHKFRYRFERLEEAVRSQGKSFDDFTLEQLEEIWQRLKSS